MGFLKTDENPKLLIESIKEKDGKDKGKDGKDNGEDKKPKEELVMATKPGDESDLTFGNFWGDVMAYNVKNGNHSKATKLNFKENDAVFKAVEMMEKDWDKYVCEIHF